MADRKWKDALWNLLDIGPLRRITGRVALSAGLLGLAAQSSPAGVTETRVPVSPVLAPEATVRKFKGRYVLRRVANALTVRFAAHGSHRSHSSHASHASHSSSSHYSGAHSSHFSSSPSPTPAPSTPPDLPPSAPPRAARPPKPQKAPPMLKESFDASDGFSERWRVGVLATAAETFDSNVVVDHGQGVLRITPLAHKRGAHFNDACRFRPSI